MVGGAQREKILKKISLSGKSASMYHTQRRLMPGLNISGTARRKDGPINRLTIVRKAVGIRDFICILGCVRLDLQLVQGGVLSLPVGYRAKFGMVLPGLGSIYRQQTVVSKGCGRGIDSSVRLRWMPGNKKERTATSIDAEKNLGRIVVVACGLKNYRHNPR